MVEFLVIFKDIILPIFILMAIGYFLYKRFTLDLATLAKLNIYFLVPGFIFVKLYEATFGLKLFLYVLTFFLLLVFLLYILALITAYIMKIRGGKKTTFANSVMFFNSGNYGVPVNDLVFRGDPFAMSIQVIVLTLQNIFLFSYGIFSLRAAKEGRWKAALGYFKMPVLYAMLSGVLLNAWNVPIPEPIWIPANYIADAMIAIALMTLGAQVAKMKFKKGLYTVYASVVLRLIGGPILALCIIVIFQLEDIMAQALFIASAMPTSVNSAVIAEEYKSHPDLAAQTVLFSTVASMLTVTIVVYIAKLLF
ncbi:membrane protein [Gracilibacillus boraciitolerans JCM 21714]|uniref:Membrane protein n=1 Tax=Gracilibacillus boraciitolerans JCM 21714 TaxID=1298598 RepID=W4VF95_9BACI|nr:AEC family transporter [Gracilibacillus boraciitolerans]GAE91882.1 membrane protein [Gracilibacillus boraciitolerans JCM 21714]